MPKRGRWHGQVLTEAELEESAADFSRGLWSVEVAEPTPHPFGAGVWREPLLPAHAEAPVLYHRGASTPNDGAALGSGAAAGEPEPAAAAVAEDEVAAPATATGPPPANPPPTEHPYGGPLPSRLPAANKKASNTQNAISWPDARRHGA